MARDLAAALQDNLACISIDDEAVDGVVVSDLILLKAEVAQLLAQEPQVG